MEFTEEGIARLVEDFREAEISDADFHKQFWAWIADHEIAEVLSKLPDHMALRLEQCLRQSYKDNLPEDRDPAKVRIADGYFYDLVDKKTWDRVQAWKKGTKMKNVENAPTGRTRGSWAGFTAPVFSYQRAVTTSSTLTWEYSSDTFAAGSGGSGGSNG